MLLDYRLKGMEKMSSIKMTKEQAAELAKKIKEHSDKYHLPKGKKSKKI